MSRPLETRVEALSSSAAWSRNSTKARGVPAGDRSSSASSGTSLPGRPGFRYCSVPWLQ